MSEPDPEPPRRLLSIEWGKVNLTSDAEALALWTQIAPTGADFMARIDEVPGEHDRALAIALLRSGNFQCVPAVPQRDCSPKLFDMPEPEPTAGLTDPCLRRLLAYWALDQLEPEDVPSVMTGLRTIAALPPPEGMIVKKAIDVVPSTDGPRKLELIALAHKAGQRDIANDAMSDLDEASLIEAAKVHHIDGALEMLHAEAHRAVYIAVITDELMEGAARVVAINELAQAEPDKLAVDTRGAIVKATAAKDCAVAAAAARVLANRNDKKYLPKRARTQAGMMRAMCVLASYEQQQTGEASLLPSFVPPNGLERIEVAYDVLSDVDTDGDGDPHTQRDAVLVPHGELVLPEVDDLVKAMHRCKGTVCTSDDREFKFHFKQAGADLVLHRLEIVERPPCSRP